MEKGKIIQVLGPVIDVQFSGKGLPMIKDALTVEVDGKTFEYDSVWIAPTMKGRFYGGGMMMAPAQDRNSDKVTLVIYMSKSKIKALKEFPSIFKGEHINKTDMVKVHTGNHIHVKFSRPCSAQIDGETVLNVTEYSVDL